MRKILLWAVPLMVFGLQPARATLVSTITSGDKVFTNITCTVATNTGTTSGNCDSLSVVADVDAFGNYGIKFIGGITAFTGGELDLNITYTVTAPGALITDLHMIFNGSVQPPGSTAFTHVTEQVAAVGGGVVGQIDVFNPPPILEAAANVTGGPYASLNVDKDILLTGGNGYFATMSSIGQYFSQVPEPGSIVLFGTVLLATMGVIRRRRSV